MSQQNLRKAQPNSLKHFLSRWQQSAAALQLLFHTCDFAIKQCRERVTSPRLQVFDGRMLRCHVSKCWTSEQCWTHSPPAAISWNLLTFRERSLLTWFPSWLSLIPLNVRTVIEHATKRETCQEAPEKSCDLGDNVHASAQQQPPMDDSSHCVEAHVAHRCYNHQVNWWCGTRHRHWPIKVQQTAKKKYKRRLLFAKKVLQRKENQKRNEKRAKKKTTSSKCYACE